MSLAGLIEYIKVTSYMYASVFSDCYMCRFKSSVIYGEILRIQFQIDPTRTNISKANRMINKMKCFINSIKLNRLTQMPCEYFNPQQLISYPIQILANIWNVLSNHVGN